ncbi:CCA tRNA nucleotidyltransferase [Tropicibacter sp. R16_0]|uniref:CCA tRNA nucleotidyltransferase n=1 Tax=Tropicibacter sp. R16_0 TaxID=2821102 RepID=UPI001AD97FFA|nr:CCA tRNA nucleotidyltransferase [Tropicibacter sp. R16_0]MBO9452391.1 CCA tRNA nucleotidyltransferase [Tropicibacter sp. R16_0]
MTRITEDWLTSPATQKVCAALTDGGAQALFVGGCVRNALLNAPVSDIDISTNVHPERVMELAKAAGIKAVPTGIEHGTVTLVQGGEPFEITTFRRDVETDGRRAIVAFAETIEEDAARRDFTMNAIYARPDGTVIDPLNGLPDLIARRVRFIGTAEHRIREDYLRSLRFFRFHAWYGDADAGFDADALAAIAANLDGLERLSRERVGAEMLKLLGASDPAPSVAAMRTAGVLGAVLPGADDRALGPVVHVEGELGEAPDAVLRLASMGDANVVGTLRLSKAQLKAVEALREAATGTAGAAELGYRLGRDQAIKAMVLRSALLEMPIAPNVRCDAEQGSKAVLPVSAKDLLPNFKGRELGEKLSQLERTWIASGFELTREELLAT